MPALNDDEGQMEKSKQVLQKVCQGESNSLVLVNFGYLGENGRKAAISGGVTR